jgi:hypothetical protein
MSGWGGYRPGGGRPKGSQSANVKARKAAQREIVHKVVQQFQIDHPDAFPGDAVSLLQCIYRDAALPLEVRIDAAKAVARFERPQLAAVMTNDASNISPLGAVLVPYKSLAQSEVSSMVIDAAVEVPSGSDD